MSDTVSSYSGVYSPAEMIQVNEIERLRSRVAQLEAALRDIANHPHNSYDYEPSDICVSLADGAYKMGVTDGHRCAANIARAVLREEERG